MESVGWEREEEEGRRQERHVHTKKQIIESSFDFHRNLTEGFEGLE